MSRIAIRSSSGFLVSLGLVSSLALADDRRPVHEPPDLGATQVTLAIDNGGRLRPFQATVLAINDDIITVLTAASFVDGDIATKPAHWLLGGDQIEGTVVAVARNPAHIPGRPKVLPRVTEGRAPTLPPTSSTTFYNNTRLRSIAQPMRMVNRQQMAATSTTEIPGANNAIARFRFPSRPDPNQNETIARAFRKIRPITSLASGTYPGGSGGTAVIRVVGGDGRVHGVMACNYHNPVLLEWGHGYDPVIDDSGAGVFVFQEAADGRLEPVLIGVVIGPDSRGGTASLVARGMPWVQAALASKEIPVSR